MENTNPLVLAQPGSFLCDRKIQRNMEGFSSRFPTKPPFSEDKTHTKLVKHRSVPRKDKFQFSIFNVLFS